MDPLSVKPISLMGKYDYATQQTCPAHQWRTSIRDLNLIHSPRHSSRFKRIERGELRNSRIARKRRSAVLWAFWRRRSRRRATTTPLPTTKTTTIAEHAACLSAYLAFTALVVRQNSLRAKEKDSLCDWVEVEGWTDNFSLISALRCGKSFSAHHVFFPQLIHELILSYLWQDEHFLRWAQEAVRLDMGWFI